MANDIYNGYNQMATPVQPVYPTNVLPQQYYNRPQQMMTLDTVAQVSGIDGANSYPVGSGHTALLVDFPAGLMWLKATDMRGVLLPLEEYRIQKIERQPEPVNQGQNNYATKAEIQELKDLILGMNNRMMQPQMTPQQNQQSRNNGKK